MPINIIMQKTHHDAKKYHYAKNIVLQKANNYAKNIIIHKTYHNAKSHIIIQKTYNYAKNVLLCKNIFLCKNTSLRKKHIFMPRNILYNFAHFFGFDICYLNVIICHYMQLYACIYVHCLPPSCFNSFFIFFLLIFW